MKLKTDENELIQAFTRLIKLPFPQLRAALAHKALELEHMFEDELEEYREIESFVDPGSKKEKPTETVKEYVKMLNFELEKIKEDWTVFPIIHPEVINHILAHAQECEPGIINMHKITIEGQTVDLGFVKKNENFFTGQLIKKCSEKMTRQAKKESPSKQALSSPNKTEDLKTLLNYLLNHDDFYQYVYNEFRTNWKPLIDTGFLYG